MHLTDNLHAYEIDFLLNMHKNAKKYIFMWGFIWKANLDTLFSKQKNALGDVMPEYVEYDYKNGILPGHTKLASLNNKIWSICNVIAFNALLLLHKVRNIPSLVQTSIRAIISEDSPGPESNYETCENLFKTYGSHIYAKSVFFKGPLILVNSTIIENLSPANFKTLKAYKINIKQALLGRQGGGDINEWQTDNLFYMVPRAFVNKTLTGIESFKHLHLIF